MEADDARLAREMHALGDVAVRPFDAAAMAHAIAVSGQTIHPGASWSIVSGRRQIWLALGLAAIVATALALCLLVASRRTDPLAFAAGSIAFVRGGDLIVAAPDGTTEVVVESATPETVPTDFAFAPDRRHLAFVRYGMDAFARARGSCNEGTAVVADARGRFAWATGGDRLAVYNHDELHHRHAGWRGAPADHATGGLRTRQQRVVRDVLSARRALDRRDGLPGPADSLVASSITTGS